MTSWSVRTITYRLEGESKSWRLGPVQFKSRRPRWRPDEHPRDRRGRFAEKPGGPGFAAEAPPRRAASGVAEEPEASPKTTAQHQLAQPARATKGETLGVPTVRPVLYTEDREEIFKMGFEADPSQSQNVKDAVARLRARQTVSAAQASELADAIRGYNQGPDIPEKKRRTNARAANWLDAAAAEIEGREPPQVPGRDTVVKTTAKELAHGDTVALVGPDRSVDVVTVRGAKSNTWGVTTLTVEHQDGREEVREVLSKASAYLLPDPPEPTEIPPTTTGPRREHIHPSLLRPGDTVQLGQDSVTVEKVIQVRPTEWQATLSNADGDTEVKRLSPEEGRPSVIRTGRGPGSERQPWDRLMPPEFPTPVTAEQIKIGDRIEIPTRGSARGTVEKIIPPASPGGRSTAVLMNDNGIRWSYTIDEGTIRLVEADNNVEARIQQAEEQARLIHRASVIDYAMTRHRREVRDRALNSVELMGYGSAKYRADGLRNAAHSVGEMSTGGREVATAIARVLEPGQGPAQLSKLIESIQPLARELAAREYRSIADQLESSVPLPGETENDAIRATVTAMRDAEPGSSFADAAAALARWSPESVQVTDEGLPALPRLPDDADLKQRIAAYRDFIGGSGQGFGKRRSRRTVMRTPSLTDLEAGIPPVSEQVDDFALERRATDGGPGAATMRQLEALRLAGNEMWSRVEELMEAERSEASRKAEALKAEADVVGERLMAAMDRQYDAMKSLRDSLAKENGYRNWDSLLVALGKAREKGGNSSAEVIKMERLRDNISATAERRMPRDEVERLEREQRQLFRRMDTPRADERAMRRRAVLRTIGEVRDESMGGSLAYRVRQKESGDSQRILRIGDTDREQLQTAMQFAAQSYPQSWLAKIEEPYKIKLASRGYHSNRKKEIALSRGQERIKGATRYGGVAVHELGHAMELNIPGLTEAQEAFLWSRTTDGEPGDRSRPQPTTIYAGKDEVGWKDRFKSHYTGRAYGSHSKHYEIFTTGYEELVGGEGDYLDPDFRNWLLGAMALL